MMVLIRFWWSLTNNSVKSASLLDMKYNIIFYSSFRTFLHGSRSRFFRIGSRFLADPDPDSTKSLIRIRAGKNRIRNTEFGFALNVGMQQITDVAENPAGPIAELFRKPDNGTGYLARYPAFLRY